jgi:hypothetical protein
MAENFPVTPFYSLENEITELPIGEAFVTVLNEKGVPTPVVRTWMAPPASKIGTIGEDRIENLVSSSVLFKKYSPPSTIHSEVNPQLISFHKALLERQNRKHEELKRAKDEEKQLSKKPKQTTAKIAGRDGVNPLMQAYANMMGFASSQNNAQPPGNFNAPIQYYYSVDGTRKGPYQAEEIRQLVANGVINAHTYIWRTGMANWAFLNEFTEFN